MLSLGDIRDALGVCFLINMGLLLFWFGVIAFAHDWAYRMHSKWFKVPVETFDTIHYAGVSFFKITIFAFNLVPYLALCIVG